MDLLRPLGQVDGVFLQRLPVFLGIGIDHLFAATNFIDRLLDGLAVRTSLLQNIGQRTLQIHRRQDKQLTGNVLVATLLSQLVGQVQNLDQVVGKIDLALSATDSWQALQAFTQLGPQLIHPHARLAQQVPAGAALLVQQRNHHVRRLNQLMIHAHSQALGIRQGQLELTRQLVHSHDKYLNF